MFTKEMKRLNEDKSMQTKYTETWVAVLGILFYRISWKSVEEAEEEDKLHVSKEKSRHYNEYCI